MKNSKYKFFLWGAVFLAVMIILLFLYLNFLRKEVGPSPVKQLPESQLSQANQCFSSWSLATSSAEWQPRDSAVSFVFQNKIWTMGGLNGNRETNNNRAIRYWKLPHFNDIWASEDGVNWQLMQARAKWSPRRSMSVVLFQDKLWMFGGWSPVTGYRSDIWQSSDGITWTKVVSRAPWPAREGQTVEVFQGKIWLMGGVNYNQRETKNDIWWSDNGVDWHKATTTIPWSSRWDHATAVFNGKIFLAGGMDLRGQIFKDVWSSADGLNWELTNSNPPWQERQGHSLVVLHDKLWIIGILNDTEEGGGVNDIWYSYDGVTWQKTQTDPPWLSREDHSVLVFNNRIYVFGGMDLNQQWRNDVWFSTN